MSQKNNSLGKAVATYAAAKVGKKVAYGCFFTSAGLIALFAIFVIGMIMLVFSIFSFGGKEDLKEPYMRIGSETGVYWPDMLIYDGVRTENTYDGVNERTIKDTADLFDYEETYCTPVTDEDGNYVYDENGLRVEECETVTHYYTLEEVMRMQGFSEEEIEYALYLQQETPYILAVTTVDYSKFEGQYLWPVPTLNKITSLYGERIHPITKKKQFHYGLDISGDNALGAPVVAIADGTVYQIREDKTGCGTWIQLLHDEQTMMSRYCHLDSVADNLKPSDKVKAGQVIGYVGNTGDSTGPHLHLEIKIDGVTVDPLPLIYNNRRR